MTHLDPVCGMTIEEEEAVGSFEHGGVRYFFCHPSCLERFRENPSSFLTVPAGRGSRGAGAGDDVHLPDGSGGSPEHGRAVPEVRHGPRARPCQRTADEDRVHLSDAPRGRAGRAGLVPDLRNGARAADGDARGRAQPRARRHGPSFPPGGGDRRAGLRAHDARHGSGRRDGAGCARQLGRTGVVDAGGVLGRMAVFRARVALDRQPQSQHVHPDRARRRRRVFVQRHRHDRTRTLPANRSDAWRGGHLLRHRRRDHGAGAARAGARAAGARTHQQGHSTAARPGAAHRAGDPRRRRARSADRAGADRRCLSRPSRERSCRSTVS